MKLRNYTIEQLAEMVVGDHPAFPYKSSSLITRFFDRCGLPFVHDGTTRKRWTAERLKELNLGPGHSPDLPSDDLLRVITQMFHLDDFERDGKELAVALEHFNKIMANQGLAVYLDSAHQCHVRNTGTGNHSAGTVASASRPLSADEIAQRSKVVAFLDSASEDEFTNRLLVPLFRRLGFHRVSAAGHHEKILEYGKDLWMKYQIPTGHWLYFGAQVKRDKLDVKGSGVNTNTATVLNQVRMAIDHPLFDPDTARKVLVDHVFVISAGEITRAARNWLVEKLDQSQRRQIIFMDREEFLDHSARILLDLTLNSDPSAVSFDEIPF